MNGNFDIVIPGAVLAGLLILVILIRLYQRKKYAGTIQLEQMLQTFVKDEVRSIIIPDGLGGLIEVDRLILTDHGLLVIETYPLVGHLFGADNIDQWTQIIGGRSFKFANPSHHLLNIKHALQALAPKTPIYSRVVFTAEGDFPKGIPDGVSLLSTLEQDLQNMLKSPMIQQHAEQMWNRILRIARKNGQAVLRDATDS